MVLVFLLAKVISLDKRNFDGHDTKMVKFFAPWCGHCKAFAPEYERLSDIANFPVTEVDCDSQKELCNANGVTGFPTIKFYYQGDSYDYEGPRSAESIIEFTEQMKLPPLSYDDVDLPGDIWFEYHTDHIDED